MTKVTLDIPDELMAQLAEMGERPLQLAASTVA